MSKVTTDPIADMLSRMRNAIAVSKPEVVLPYSKVKEAVATILVSNKFAKKTAVSGAGIEKVLTITLSTATSNSPITEINRLSTPGRRMYCSAAEIPVVKRGRGLVVISTSKGMMTGFKAKAEGLGGELICKVY